MTQGILDGILNEIASSFVSLTPRNDGISAMTAIWWDPPVKLGDDTGLGILEFLEIASVALLPRNDAGNSRIPSIRDPRVKPKDDKENQVRGWHKA